MNNAIESSRLADGGNIWQVSLKKLNKHSDHRGSFSEIFRDEWGTVIKPVQWSLVKSEANVLRGMHFHLRHDEYFCLTKGHCLVALKDVRSDSTSEGVYSIFELFGADLAALVFPRGIIHGWYFFEASTHVQAVSESFSDYGADDNWGVSWNAPDLGVPWPAIDPILSDRANNFSSIERLKTAIANCPL